MGDVNDAVAEVRQILDELVTGQTAEGEPIGALNGKTVPDRLRRIQELVAEHGLVHRPRVYDDGTVAFTVEAP